MDQSTPQPGNTDLFPAALGAQMPALSAALAPRLEWLEARFRALCRGHSTLERRALAAITLGAAARLFTAGKPPEAFLEQVGYNGRRLAKLNVPSPETARLLCAYDQEADGILARSGRNFRAARAQIRLATQVAVERAYYDVREMETQVFYGLFRAELEAGSLEDLLSRSVGILNRALRAESGRLFAAGEAVLAPALLRRLARPRYIERGAREESLIVDGSMRGRHAAYWSVPLRHGGRVVGVAQFGFPEPYRWLPRELALLDAAGERWLAAAERTRLIRDLAARERQVRQLAAHLIRAEEQERRRLSRELHDEAGQSLLLLRLELERLEGSCPFEGAFRKQLGEAGKLAARSIEEVRRAIAALNPAVIDRLGLPAAVRQLGARFEKLHGSRVRLSIGAALPELSIEWQTAAYRLVQECLNNIARHAHAGRVNISLRTSDRWLEVRVSDNGSGFDVNAALEKPDCFGLLGMRERVTVLGGTVEIRSRPGAGTSVLARLPRLHEERDSDGQDSSDAHR